MSHEVLAEVYPASAYYIEQVKRKQASGVYPLEAAACFCGRTDGRLVAQTDRYGFDHCMVVCPSCGILRATPRMTAAAYAQFYANEYRLIYGAHDDLPEEQARDAMGGETILQFIRNRTDHQVTSVFDFGCNDGSYLVPFKDAGCTVYGVDYNPATVVRGQARGLDLAVGGLELLEARGKADLVLANHVLEHCLDLEDTITRLSRCLAPNGLLFVGVPGLYKWDRTQLWQNAHVWQFTAETLGYVMRCCGFEEVYCDQHIVSLWEYTGECDHKSQINASAARHIQQFLADGTRYAPEIRTVNKFPLAERKHYIDAALATGHPDLNIYMGQLADTPAIIVGGGPSADLHVEHIETLLSDGAALIAIERMLPWCLSHGLVPDYVVVMDASEDVTDALHTLPTTTRYLVATQCQPAVFDKLTELDVAIYNTPQRGIKMADLWHKHNRDVVTQINGGGSVVLCAMSIAMTLGARRLHVFGFDCHVTSATYANGIAGVGTQDETFEVSAKGQEKRYRTTAAYLSFAQQFFKLMEMARREGLIETVHVYGDSLVKALHRPEGPLGKVMQF
jgi:SAM-dependent methyltransferase